MSTYGYATYESEPTKLGRATTQVGVFRYGEGGSFEPMPWLRVQAVEEEQEGGEPGIAQLRYRFADPTDREPETITGVEQVYGLEATGDGVLRNDDRIVVAELDADGNLVPVFDGFCQAPSLAFSPGGHTAAITAVSAETRAYDIPLSGSKWRDSSDAVGGDDVDTNLPLIFNPTKDGVVQAGMLKTKSNWPKTDKGLEYPVFIDATILYDDKETTDIWYLPQAVRYCLAIGNPDEEFVKNPDGDLIDQVLQAIVPKANDGSGYFDPSNSLSFDLKPIPVPDDINIDGQHWPEAIRSLINPHGFGICFRLELDDNGAIQHRLDIYRKVDSSDGVVQELRYQTRGSILDPSLTDIGSAQLTRDSSGIANQFRILTGIVEYEGSFVLYESFEVSAGDVTIAAQFRMNDPKFTGASINKYRDFIMDEAGEGHWDGSKILKGEPEDLTAIFGDDAFGDNVYVHRRREPGRQLFSLDPFGDRLEAELWVSSDTKQLGGIWDRTGTWQRYTGGWELLEDRIGIRITSPDPADINIGKPPASSGTAKYPFPSGKINIIKSLAAPDSTNPKFRFRLTCTIAGDRDLGIYALRRPASPTKFIVERQDVARSRFVKHVITKSSSLGKGDKTNTVRDDTDEAQHYADARRLAHELGPTAGPVVIPRITSRYRVGNRISSISGIGLSLLTNLGSGTGESPAYPSIVKVVRRYDPEQQTEIHLSDRRGEPRRGGRW